MGTESLLEVGWIIIAFAAGAGARLLRLPPLVGYLVAGMGLATLGVSEGPVIARIGEVGVALLLFMVGLDVRWKNLVRAEVLGVGGLHLLAVTGVGTAIGLALGLPPLGAVVVAVSFGVPSLVLAAKALDAQGGLRAYHGRVAIGIVLLQTIVATAVMAVLGEAPSPWALALLALPVLSPVLRRLLTQIESDELLVMLGLALVIGGTLLCEAVGISAELGALAAGVLLAGHDRVEDLADAIRGLKDAGIAAFFLGVGLLGVPSSQGLLVVAALTALLLVKGALHFGLLTGFRLQARTAFLTTLPVTTYSGFTLIIGSAAVEAGVLNASVLTVLGTATAVSYLVNAPVSRFAPSLWEQVATGLERFERDGPHPDRHPTTLGHAQFLVVGMGRVGTAAYDYLADLMQCIVGLDEDPGQIKQHREAGRRVVYGDARDASLWSDLDLGPLEAVLLAMSDLDTTLDAIHALRDADFDGAIIALTTTPEQRERLLAAGASAVYLSVDQTGQALARHGLRQRRDPAPTTVTLDVNSPPAEAVERHPAPAATESLAA